MVLDVAGTLVTRLGYMSLEVADTLVIKLLRTAAYYYMVA